MLGSMHRLVLVLAAALTLAAAPAASAQGFSETVAALHAADARPASPDALDDGQVAFLLREEARAWEGTPYRFGGASRSGIDCSALMQRWFEDLFARGLPRTADEQFDQGTPVEHEDLRPGDLVFFGSKSRISHVGVYVGHGEFAHASRSVGVTVSRLDEAYWERRFRSARRLLDASPDDVFLPETAFPPDTPEVFAANGQAAPRRGAPSFTAAPVRGSQAPSPRRTGW